MLPIRPSTLRLGKLAGLLALGALAVALCNWRSVAPLVARARVVREAAPPQPRRASLAPRSQPDQPAASATALARFGPAEREEPRAPEAIEGGAAQLSGSVVDVSGGIVAGASVLARGAGSLAAAVGRASSDAQGHFTLYVPPGPLELEVSAEGYASAHSSVLAPAAEVAVALVASSSVRGRVVQRGSLRPTAGVRVTATSLDGLRAPPLSAVSDERGEFWIDRLAPGGYQLEAAAATWRGEAQRLTLAVGAALDRIQIEVAPATSLSGDVQTGGKPCASGYIELSGPSRSAQLLPPDGRFVLEGLLPGEYRASIECAGAEQSPWEEQLQIGREPLTRRWELLPRQGAEGQDERPVARIEATLLGAPSDAALPTALAIGRTGLPLPGKRSGQHLLFEALPLDQYQVYLEQAPNVRASVALTRAGQLAEVQLEVPAIAEIAGRVLDAQGMPVPDAWVRASTPTAVADPVLSPVLTDAEGEFVIRGRLAGSYTLDVESDLGPGLLPGISASRGNVVRLQTR